MGVKCRTYARASTLALHHDPAGRTTIDPDQLHNISRGGRVVVRRCAMLQIPPGGTQLSEEQARLLDDEYLLSRPLQYFSARISSLLSTTPGSLGQASETVFLRALGLSELGSTLVYDASDAELQTAVDALALRHHTAEALARLLHALLVGESDRGDAPSLWAVITDGPLSLHTLQTDLVRAFEQDGHALARVFLPSGTVASDAVRLALAVALSWVNRTVQLLDGNELTLNAAHNKLKHGLAVRTRADSRMELMTDPTFDEHGNIALESFAPSRSVPIFDRSMITYLARPFPTRGQGLEATSLRIDPPAVLAEARMLAWVHACIFYVAAERHFEGREADCAPYPGLLAGPTFEDLIRNLGSAPFGYRGTITTARDASLTPRPSGVFFPDLFLPVEVDFSSNRPSSIVE